MKFKIVYTDPYHPELVPVESELDDIELDLIMGDYRTEDEVIAAAYNADALMVQHAKISRKVIESLEECRIIARFGVGFDNVDVAAATERGIMVTNVPDYCIDEVSSHAIALIMTFSRKISILNNLVKNGRWGHEAARPINRLSAQKLGIVGLGRIGSAAAAKALGLGFDVLVYDPYVSETNLSVTFGDFDTLLQNSDFVSIHAPLTVETHHMFSRNEFRKMKETAFLINTARGPIVDEAELYGALRAGIIAGAGVDVIEYEPPSPDNPILKLDNFVITPHTAFFSEESLQTLRLETTRAVATALKGGIPRSVVNPEVISKKKGK